MGQPDFIHISIPQPCKEQWDEMTSKEQGRFCSHCQKDVIDFSTWSDTSLYEFFSKKRDTVCGRFLTSQVGRYIHIPPQPHSQLYRIVVALGLTLVFIQGDAVHAQSKPPLVQTSPVDGKQVGPVGDTSNINDSMVLDSLQTPVAVLNPNPIYAMGTVPPAMMPIITFSVIPSFLLEGHMRVNNRVPLPKQNKTIRVPKKPAK